MSAIVKQTFGYSLSFLFARLQGLLLLPFVSRRIVPEEYGLFETLITYGTLAGLFAVLGMDSAMATLYRHPDYEKRQKDVATTCIGVVGIMVLLCSAALFGSHWMIQDRLFGGQPLTVEFGMLCTTIIFSSLQGMAATLLRQEFAVAKFNITSIGGALLSFTGTLIMVIGFDGGVRAMLAVQLIVAVFNAALTLKWARPYLNFGLSRDLVMPLLRLGLPVLPSAVSSWFISGLDRTLLQAWRTGKEVGDFSMAAKVAAIATVLTSAFQTAWWPYAMKMAHEPEAGPHFRQACRLSALAGAVLVTAVGCGAPFLMWMLLSPEYHQSFRSAGLQVLTGVLNAFYYFPLVALLAAMKAKLATAGYLGGMVVTVALNYLLIPWFGIAGAVWATILGLTAVICIIHFFAEREKPYQLPVIQGLLFFCLTGAANTVWFFFPAHTVLEAVLRILLIIPAVVASAFLCGLVKAEDMTLVRDRFQKIMRSLRNRRAKA